MNCSYIFLKNNMLTVILLLLPSLSYQEIAVRGEAAHSYFLTGKGVGDRLEISTLG